MSFTVAFFLGELDERRWSDIRKCAEELGLEAVRGIEAGDEEVIPGIRKYLSREPKPLEVVYLFSGTELDVPSAHELYKETVLFRAHGGTPRIFSFLRKFNRLTEDLGNERYFLACGEWSPKDEVMYLEGSVENVIEFVTATQILGLWFWSPQTGSIQGSDRYPLLFRFVA
jgi:hypothetical protein